MKFRSIFLIPLLIWAFSATAQDTDILTPLDVAQLKTVLGAVISDDGQYIAYRLFVQADPLTENKPGSQHLYVYKVADGTSVPFYTKGSVGSVAFRPGTPAITFLTKGADDKTRSLYQISLSGGEAMNIYSFDRNIGSYQWSPDGKKLAFISGEEKQEKKSVLPVNPRIYEEDLTFNRAYIVEFASAPGSAKQVNLPGHVSGVNWSPDGSKLAIVTAPTPLVDDFYMQRRIRIVDSGSLNKTGEVDHTAKMGQVTWSTDSKTIAFIGGNDINDPTAGRIFTVSDKGGKPAKIISGFGGAFDQIGWKDNKTLYYLASRGATAEFGTITVKNGETKAELTGKNYFSFQVAKNGSRIFRGDSPEHPAELFLQQAGGNAERITDSNPWLKNRRLAKQEVIKYQARDGLEIEGILIRPLNERSGQKYPMITVVHGGPESHYNNGWLTGYSQAGQVGAAQGYAVFYPNYRGSTGRGLEYTMSSQADPAGKEFDDVVDGVDYLIESGLVDGTKVGVTGGSYGGYATGWLSTKYTDRFAAGVMFVGISNNISMWGTSDIPEELYHVHARKRIWDDYQFWLERSPVYYAGQAKTPLLIMHGADDPRVHPEQSMELYRHIKTRTDTPVRLIYYPGEGHGNRRSAARFDYSLRLFRWFDRYLKGEELDMDTVIELPGK